MSLLILNKREVEELLTMQKCIGLMEDALRSLARGEVVLPLRPVLRIPDSPNAFAVMPAYSKPLNAIGAKLITVFPENHGSAFDSHQGIVVLFDGGRGNPAAIMDAASITAIRTAAVSGVATKLLARRDAAVLAILGAGVQARTHIEAMMAVRSFRRIRVWSRTSAHARDVAADAASRFDVEADAAPDAHTAVEHADVICTVTASREPVLSGAWLRPGVHVNAVGASLPNARELDSEAMRRARVFVDRRESALNEAGDVLIPMSEGAIDAKHLVAEIGELLAGSAEGRRNDDEITVFKSLGIAVEDLACAHFLLDAAGREGVGTRVDFADVVPA
jgi:ornithine cyclodeaminase/alanine dehydrogenase-like protein (mu-crystallin family)